MIFSCAQTGRPAKHARTVERQTPGSGGGAGLQQLMLLTLWLPMYSTASPACTVLNIHHLQGLDLNKQRPRGQDKERRLERFPFPLTSL